MECNFYLNSTLRLGGGLMNVQVEFVDHTVPSNLEMDNNLANKSQASWDYFPHLL